MNSYYTICIIIVWIRLYEFVQKPHHVQIHSIQFVYNLYIICIQFVYNLYSMKNCIQVGISTGDQYRACNRRCVCHPPPHLFHQWPFYLYTGQESDTYELRKPSKKRDCTNSFVCHIVNPNLQKITVEQFPSDGVFCVCVFFFGGFIGGMGHTNVQMRKCTNNCSRLIDLLTAFPLVAHICASL